MFAVSTDKSHLPVCCADLPKKYSQSLYVLDVLLLNCSRTVFFNQTVDFWILPINRFAPIMLLCECSISCVNNYCQTVCVCLVLKCFTNSIGGGIASKVIESTTRCLILQPTDIVEDKFNRGLRIALAKYRLPLQSVGTFTSKRLC